MFTLKACWRRKETQHDDALADKVRTLANTHPYNIWTTPGLAADYRAIYGDDEFNVLVDGCRSGAYNMVESFEEKWVQGGVYIPPDPIPPAPELTGDDVVRSPFGAFTGVDTAAQAEALLDKVVMSCLKRAGLVK